MTITDRMQLEGPTDLSKPSEAQQERIDAMLIRRVVMLADGKAEVEMGWGWIFLHRDGSVQRKEYR